MPLLPMAAWPLLHVPYSLVCYALLVLHLRRIHQEGRRVDAAAPP
jgi:hypothetical protein